MADLGQGWTIGGAEPGATLPPAGAGDLGKGWKLATPQEPAGPANIPASAYAANLKPPPEPDTPDTRTGPQIQAEETPDSNVRIVDGKRVNLIPSQIQRVTPPVVDDRSDAAKFLTTPLISSEDIDKALPFLVGPFRLHAGILKGAAGMTSPENAGIMAATGGLGMAADATAAATAQAARVAQAGLSGYFATQAGRALLDKMPEMRARWKAGDWQGVLETGGQQLVDAATAAGAAAHSVGSLRGAADIGRTARQLQADLDRNAQEAPRAPVAQLPAPAEAQPTPPAEPAEVAPAPPQDLGKGWTLSVLEHDPVEARMEAEIQRQEQAEIAKRNPPVEAPVVPPAPPQAASSQVEKQEVVAPPEPQPVVEQPQPAAPADLGKGWTIAPVEEPETQVQADQEQVATPAEQRGPGWVGNIPTSEINVDAPRFQFKQNVGQGGAGEELRDLEKYDPEKAGIVSVWKDPADGQTYVVNGHHRVELAQRTDQPDMTVRYLSAPNAQVARAKGAMINIAEGRGESTDAARVFRDLGITPEELAKQGVSIKGKLASEGMALSKLAQPIFDDVIAGDLSPARGAVIGAGVPNPADQQALYDLMKKREEGGKRLTNDQVGELIRMNGRTSTVTENSADQAQASMFGDEEMTRSLLPEKAEVSDYIRKQLGAEKKLFGVVGTQAAAERLGERGNVIKADENAQVAEQVNQGIALYDKLSVHSGPIDTILDQAAKRLADGEPSADVKQQAYRQIRNELTGQVTKLTGGPQGGPGRAEGLGSEGPLQTGAGERDLAPAVESEVAPTQISEARPPLTLNPLQAALEKQNAVVAQNKEKLQSKAQKIAANEKRIAELEAQQKRDNPAARVSMNLAGRRKGLASEILSGPEYKAKAPSHQNALETRAQVHEEPGQHPTLMVNRQGFAVIGEHTGQDIGDADEHPAHAWTVPLDGVKALRRELSRSILRATDPAVRQKLRFLQEAAGKATSDQDGKAGSRPLIVVNPHSGMTAGDLDRILSEERSHLKQLEINGTFYDHLETAKFFNDPLAQKAARSLAGRSYRQEDQDILAAEIGARLLEPKILPELGLTVEEENQLANVYNRALQEHNGSRANGVIQQIRSNFPAARSSGRGTGAESVRPQQARSHGPRDALPPREKPTSARFKGSEPDNLDLFGAGEQQQVARSAEQHEDKLLHDRLTAQIKSGLAAKPTKLKPAENRGLFDEEGPEQEDLFSGSRTPAASRQPKPPFLEGLTSPWEKGSTARQPGSAAFTKSLAEQNEDYGLNVRRWFTARRDVWDARNKQILEGLRKVLPDPIDQEALAIYRDFKNRPGELAQWLAGTHPAYGEVKNLSHARENIEKLRQPIERAMHPTDAMKEADQTLTAIAASSLAEGKRLGFIDKHVKPEEYVTHLLTPEAEEERGRFEEMGKALGNKIGRNFPYNIQRNFPTLLDAAANNWKPRTLNAFTAFQTYGDKFATARATHRLIEQLRASNVGVWGTKGDKNIPQGWVEIAPHAHPFRNLVGYTDEAGQPQGAYQTLFVPPVIEEALRPITDPDYTSKIAGFRKLRMFQSYTKAAQLGLSFFHAISMNYGALANMGPAGYMKAVQMARKGSLAPGFHELERDLIAHGGSTAVQGKIYEAYGSTEPTSLPTAGEAFRQLPAVKQLDQAARAITDLTFNKIQRPYKVADYAMHKAAWLAKHPDATPAEQTAAMRSIAKELNSVYGGIHWENAGWNKSTVESWRLLTLAPDWTYSNLALGRQAFEKGTPAGSMARKYWLRSMMFGLAATQAASLMFSRKPSKRPTQVYLGQDKDGKDIYQNMFFKGAAGDAANLTYNLKDYGFPVGLFRVLSNKEAPILRTVGELGRNETFLGQPIVQKGLHPLVGTARGTFYAAKGLSPIPWSASNIAEMMLNPDKYKMPLEALTTMFAGTPPSHVKEKPERDTQPLWQQLLTGKPYAPAPKRGSEAEKLQREQKRLLR